MSLQRLRLKLLASVKWSDLLKRYYLSNAVLKTQHDVGGEKDIGD